MKYKREILCVDDDSMIHDIFQYYVKNYNCNVTYISDEKEVERIIKEKKFDLIILDYRLLNLTGEQIYKKIRATDPKLPIIVLSGFLNQLIVDNVSSYGFVAFIKKPNFYNRDFFENMFLMLNIEKNDSIK